MLSALFSHVTLERILLFLFVNKQAYGSELRYFLNTPLSPIQKTLAKLEEGKVLKSFFIKNKKMYVFNPDFYLQNELQNLLKKAYLHLSLPQKQLYCQLHRPIGRYQHKLEKQDFRSNELQRFFTRLSKVRSLKIEAFFYENEKEEQKKGQAHVEVICQGRHKLVFHEKGQWLLPQFSELIFKNAFKWTFNPLAQLISIEHLRYGEDQPVFLFDLTSDKSGHLESINTFSQLNELHFASIHWTKKQIHFQWRIIGNKKNDLLHYYYS